MYKFSPLGSKVTPAYTREKRGIDFGHLRFSCIDQLYLSSGVCYDYHTIEYLNYLFFFTDFGNGLRLEN